MRERPGREGEGGERARRAPRPLPVTPAPSGGDEGDDDDDDGGEQTPADALVDEAWEADEPAERSRLAREALALDADHVDALLLLADEAASLEASLEAHAAARAAAERRLGLAPGADAGPAADGPAGRAWLRATRGHADALAALGRTGEAAAALELVARHDPDDGLGARSPLVAARLALGDDAGAAALLPAAPRAGDDEAAPEAEPVWAAWTRPLLARRKGDLRGARAAFEVAWRRNRHVAAFLLGRRRPPRDLAGRVVPGEPLEGALHALEHSAAWTATPGALDWLAAEAARPPREQGPRPRVPPGLKESLKKRPQAAGEAWQVGARRVPRWVDDEAGRSRPWLTIVLGAAPVPGAEPPVLAAEMGLDPPTAARLVDVLLTAMRRPREGPSRRPARVEVADRETADELRAACAALGVECAARAPLEPFASVVTRKARAMTPPPEPGLVATGAPDARLGRLVEAAAALYRARPWEAVPDDVALRLEGPALGGPALAVVLGHAGETFGLAVAADRAGLASLRAADDDAAPAPPPPGAGPCLALLFEEEAALPLADLERIESSGWPLAAEDAWPLVVALEPGATPRAAAPAELDRLEAAARALAAAGAPVEPRTLCVEVDGRPVELSVAVEPL